jgi:hypothetical protein
MTRYPAECLPLSLQSLTERLRGLPGLLVADVGVAHGGADVLMPEQLLNFPQIFANVIEENRRRAVSQSVGCDLPHPERSARGSEPQIERTVGKRSAEYPANTNSDAANAIPPEPKIRRPLKVSCTAFHSRSAWLKRPGTGTSWKTLPLPLIRKATISSPPSGNRSS